MGNCFSLKRNSTFEKFIGNKLAEAIDTNTLDKIREIIIKYSLSGVNKEPILNINNPIVKIYSQDMNALGYALFLGHTEAFSIILELGRAKLSMMTKLFTNLGKRPMDIICELGHRKLLEIYLPLYLTKSDQLEEEDSDSISLSFTMSKNLKSQTQEKSKVINTVPIISPLHRACEKGKLHIMQFLVEHFAGKNIPPEFNIHYQDEQTGDNCALVSCKTGVLEIIKYLFEVCKADFHILNKRKENAIQILAVWSKKRKQKKYYECFRYLVETVCVDYTYEYEETLLVLEDRDIIFYLEEKLKADGISINKSKIDDKYALGKGRVPPSIDPAMEVKLSRVRGKKFNFKELFKEELEESKGQISPIELEQSFQDISYITLLEHNK